MIPQNLCLQCTRIDNSTKKCDFKSLLVHLHAKLIISKSHIFGKQLIKQGYSLHLFKIQSETSMSIRRSYRYSMNKNPCATNKVTGKADVLILPFENTTLHSWKADKF